MSSGSAGIFLAGQPGPLVSVGGPRDRVSREQAGVVVSSRCAGEVGRKKTDPDDPWLVLSTRLSAFDFSPANRRDPLSSYQPHASMSTPGEFHSGQNPLVEAYRAPVMISGLVAARGRSTPRPGTPAPAPLPCLPDDWYPGGHEPTERVTSSPLPITSSARSSSPSVIVSGGCSRSTFPSCPPTPISRPCSRA